jgi:hypothetical protein
VKQRLIQKAADCGILDNKLKQDAKQVKASLRHIETMLTMSKLIAMRDEHHQSLTDAFNQSTRKSQNNGEKSSLRADLEEAFKEHGHMGARQLLMVRFLEQLSSDDLRTFVKPFMTPEEDQ